LNSVAVAVFVWGCSKGDREARHLLAAACSKGTATWIRWERFVLSEWSRRNQVAVPLGIVDAWARAKQAGKA